MLRSRADSACGQGGESSPSVEGGGEEVGLDEEAVRGGEAHDVGLGVPGGAGESGDERDGEVEGPIALGISARWAHNITSTASPPGVIMVPEFITGLLILLLHALFQLSLFDFLSLVCHVNQQDTENNSANENHHVLRHWIALQESL